MRRKKEISLIRMARQGDTAAFGEIIRRYQHLVFATAFQVVKNKALAEDVAQEAFVSAFRALKDLREESAFPSWLRRITRNRALVSRKEQGRFVAIEDAGLLDTLVAESGPENERDGREEDAFREEVRRIVSSLSDTLRFPVLLCYLDDLPTASAARYLGITEGALRKRIHDGKKKLQERIVRMAEKRFQEYRLPRDFAHRCICGCRQAREAKAKGTDKRR